MLKILQVTLQDFSRPQLREKLKKIILNDAFTHIATVNPEFLVSAQKNKKFLNLLQNTLNICDGFGIKVLAKLFHQKNITRITGVELAEMICKTAAETHQSVFFLGGQGVAGKAAQAMQLKYKNLKIAGSLDGDENSFEEIKKTSPDIILVAFGAPKQEFWISEKASQIPSLKLAIGVGGTFDFWASKVKRAPKIMQKTGLEWLWRLCQEPLKRAPRIWKAVVVFPCLALKEKFKK